MIQSVMNQLQDITNQIHLQTNSSFRSQSVGQNQTKADQFANAFNEHIRQLGASQNDNRISFNTPQDWAMGIANTEITGSFGKAHVAPNIQARMEADPLVQRHFTDKIRDFRNNIPNMKREFSMMGMEITSVSLIIHEDGSVTHMTWARSKFAGVPHREIDEPDIYREQPYISNNMDVSSFGLESMAGILGSVNVDRNYKRILALS
ncbi:MAG: DUF6033 family protein [Defluviitaleaceae bacterium]|nr:DUF6033 family protein [Defluviitaleaceae bacterium]MCL2275374.1 DUF6033 family protein [Defluviitaleaceae bacterium]